MNVSRANELRSKFEEAQDHLDLVASMCDPSGNRMSGSKERRERAGDLALEADLRALALRAEAIVENAIARIDAEPKVEQPRPPAKPSNRITLSREMAAAILRAEGALQPGVLGESWTELAAKSREVLGLTLDEVPPFEREGRPRDLIDELRRNEEKASTPPTVPTVPTLGSSEGGES